jgi:threonine/homoserine/homoserine lactone efflux protein
MDLSLFSSAEFFWKGLIIGFAIAAPVGPIGVLCIRRTLAEGRMAGLLSGLGAATADAMYGCVAGFGLTLVSDFLIDYALWIRVLGGSFLCYLGVKTFLDTPAEQAATPGSRLASAYGSTVLLTLTNPATILSFVAVFAGLGLASTGQDYASASILVLGVFVGSGLWWLLLSGGVSFLRGQFTPQRLRWINRISGVILIAFGVLALSSTLLSRP